MKHAFRIISKLSVWILVLFLSGCTENDFEDLPQVESSFTYTINEDSGTVTFINVSKEATTYNWDFGDGTTSREKDPIKTYARSGTYKVTLVASNQAGASNTFEDEISLVIKEVVKLPITFDDENVAYDFSTFGGASFEIVENPDVSGSNDKEGKVGELANGGNEFEGIFIDLGIPIDLSDKNAIRMNFWSEEPIAILLKLEEGTAGAIETTVNHTGSGWEQISFTFDSSESYSRLTLFADGPGKTAGTFYFDDIEQVEGDGGGGPECTAETSQSLDAADFDLTFQTDPGDAIGSFGGNYSYIDNPDFDNAVNPSCKVGQIDRNGEQFANTQIEFDSKFDFNTNSGFKLKVWSPVAGTNVLVKLEDKTDPGINVEVAQVTSAANAWEELTFDFAPGESGKHDRIILFFELNSGVVETYYIDDFRLYGDGGGGGELATFPLDFEDGALFFTPFEGATAAIIDNPDATGNPSSKVLELVKPAGVPFYAGMNSDQTLNGPSIDLANGFIFKMKIWSPKAGIKVRMRLEQEPGVVDPPAYELFQTVDTANEWVTLTFDFSATGAADTFVYTRLVLNTDWDTDPAGGEAYYIDDITQE